MIISIDGPAASGKSTVAKLIAAKLGYLYIDSGAMYRAVTLAWLRWKEDWIAASGSSSLPRNDGLDEILKNFDLSMGKKVTLNGEDISEAIRTNEVSKNVSHVASFKIVRDKLVEMQRQIAGKQDVVMDGRDIGTVVFPDAELKIFMIASSRVRAERRLKDLEAKGEAIDLETLIKEIETRDKLDSEREESPLMKAEGAIEINTDGMTIDEVVNKVIELKIQV